MTLTLIPDAELLVGVYLREHEDVAALGVRVAGTIPSSQTLPFVRLTQLDARDTGNVEHLVDYMLQLDCYAGSAAMKAHAGQAEAWLVARTVRAALKALQDQVRDGAVISDVVFTSMPRIPDHDFEPARERIVLNASISMHPA